MFRASSRPSFWQRYKYLIPNLMTTVRLLLIIPFMFFVNNGDHVSASITALVAILSDVDGTVARKIGATSKFGALYDPLVDATFIIVGLGILVQKGEVWWLAVVAFLLAALIKAIPQFFYFKRHKEVKSVILSKTAGMIGFVAVIVGAWGVPMIVTTVLLGIGTVIYLLLGILWIYQND